MSGEARLLVSSSPHIRDRASTRSIMLDVIIALIPSLVASTILFGLRALTLTLVTVAVAVIAEAVSRKVMKREDTIADLSAVVTGMLLAFNLPPTLPLLDGRGRCRRRGRRRQAVVRRARRELRQPRPRRTRRRGTR